MYAAGSAPAPGVGDASSTVFLGSISPGVSDRWLVQLLQVRGVRGGRFADGGRHAADTSRSSGSARRLGLPSSRACRRCYARSRCWTLWSCRAWARTPRRPASGSLCGPRKRRGTPWTSLAPHSAAPTPMRTRRMRRACGSSRCSPRCARRARRAATPTWRRTRSPTTSRTCPWTRSPKRAAPVCSPRSKSSASRPWLAMPRSASARWSSSAAAPLSAPSGSAPRWPAAPRRTTRRRTAWRRRTPRRPTRTPNARGARAPRTMQLGAHSTPLRRTRPRSGSASHTGTTCVHASRPMRRAAPRSTTGCCASGTRRARTRS